MDNLFVGCALSDVNQADVIRAWRVPERLADYAKHFQQHVGTADFSFELQPEDPWTLPVRYPDQYVDRANNRWWRTFRNNEQLLSLIRNTCAPIGVHQPVQGHDLLSSNYYDKYHGIAETQRAMAFAQFIHADYFIFHLATVDKWGWDRHDQISKALKVLGAFAAYYHASKFDFIPCIELLPYPRFPATGGDAAALLCKVREVWEDVQLAFNISHLWGSRERMIAAHEWKSKDGEPVSFIEALEVGLAQTWEDICVFQLGGCWESEMHAIPGLHPQQDPFHYPLKLTESPGVYAEAGELDLNRTLDLLLEYTLSRGRPLNLTLEIYNRDIEQVLEAARQIRTELIRRAENPLDDELPDEEDLPEEEPPHNGNDPSGDGDQPPDGELAAD